jgi:hypothetical protein
MSAESAELVIPWSKPTPVTPKGQSFTPQTLPGSVSAFYVMLAGVLTRSLSRVDSTPHGLKGEALKKPTDDIRAEIGREMNKETLLCPIDKFLKHYGPTPDIDTKDVAKCKKYLVASGLLKSSPATKKFRWRDFAFNPSQYKQNTEQRVFEDLKPIIDTIFQYAEGQGKGRGNNYRFEMVPHKYLEAEISGTNHKMDGCMVDPEYTAGLKLPVRLIVFPHEYKKRRHLDDQRIVSARLLLYRDITLILSS